MPELEIAQSFNVRVNCDDVHCIECPIRELCDTQDIDKTFDNLDSAIEHYIYLNDYLNKGSD